MIPGVMQTRPDPRLDAVFARSRPRRWSIVAVYALLVPAPSCSPCASRRDNSLDRMIVGHRTPRWPPRASSSEVFPERPVALLLVESARPAVAPAVARGGARAPGAPGPHPAAVSTYSVLTVWDRIRRTGRWAARRGGAPPAPSRGLPRFVARHRLLPRPGPGRRRLPRRRAGLDDAGARRARRGAGRRSTAPSTRRSGGVPADRARAPARRRALGRRLARARDRPRQPALLPALRRVRGRPHHRPVPLVAGARRHPRLARRGGAARHGVRRARGVRLHDRLRRWCR